VIALTEDHCAPAPDWCAAVARAHATTPYAAIGGVVDKAGPDAAVGWALYFCDYARYMPPLRGGPADYLTDCNVSYKRDALDAVRDVWAAEFHETAVHWALQARGEVLWLAPSVVVRQGAAPRRQIPLRERFRHGRIFAGTRAARTSRPARAGYAAASLLLPAVAVGRAVARVIRKRRRGWQLVRALPAMVALSAAWALGEAAGYVVPPRGRPLPAERA
jgi:hypothetical protein